MINTSWSWLFIYLSFFFYIFFLRIAENNKFKKNPVGQNFVITIFLFFLKVGLVIPVDQQINFVLP